MKVQMQKKVGKDKENQTLVLQNIRLREERAFKVMKQPMLEILNNNKRTKDKKKLKVLELNLSKTNSYSLQTN